MIKTIGDIKHQTDINDDTLKWNWFLEMLNWKKKQKNEEWEKMKAKISDLLCDVEEVSECCNQDIKLVCGVAKLHYQAILTFLLSEYKVW